MMNLGVLYMWTKEKFPREHAGTPWATVIIYELLFLWSIFNSFDTVRGKHYLIETITGDIRHYRGVGSIKKLGGAVPRGTFRRKGHQKNFPRHLLATGGGGGGEGAPKIFFAEMLALIKGHIEAKMQSEQHFSRKQRALCHRKKGTFENLGALPPLPPPPTGSYASASLTISKMPKSSETFVYVGYKDTVRNGHFSSTRANYTCQGVCLFSAAEYRV